MALVEKWIQLDIIIIKIRLNHKTNILCSHHLCILGFIEICKKACTHKYKRDSHREAKLEGQEERWLNYMKYENASVQPIANFNYYLPVKTTFKKTTKLPLKN